MNVQVTAVKIHEPAAVRAIVAEAIAIARDNPDGNVSADAIFAQACVLLGARATVAAPQQPVQLPHGIVAGLPGRLA